MPTSYPTLTQGPDQKPWLQKKVGSALFRAALEQLARHYFSKKKLELPASWWETQAALRALSA